MSVLLACQLLVPSGAAAQTPPPTPAPKAAAPAAPKPAPKPAEPAPAAPKAAEPAPAPAQPPPSQPEPDPAETTPAAPTPAAPTPAAPTPAKAPASPAPVAEPSTSGSTAVPASPAPVAAAAQPAGAAEAPTAATSYPLQVVSPIPGLQLQVYSIELDDVTRGPTRDFDDFSDTCAAPCRTSLAPGAYQLTVKAPDGRRATTSTGLLLEGPATVDVDIVSHASTRRQGWYWALIGSGIGGIATGVGLSQDCGPDHDCAKGASFGIWTGITVMAVSWLIGIPKITTKDEATVTIRPGITGGPTAGGPATRTRATAHGSQLAGAF